MYAACINVACIVLHSPVLLSSVMSKELLCLPLIFGKHSLEFPQIREHVSLVAKM